MTKRSTAAAGLLIALLSASAARAEEDVFEFFREEAKVSTASRRPESAWRTPVAVDVVTAAEIKAYGYRSLWDILRFRTGMDVIDGRSADGNRAIVSARGFSRDFVSEMQVLVDGRSVYSSFLGGVYWASLPVQLQDIERVEIVRGPNAALYGSNAALGVINIITRKPEKKPAGRLSARGGNRVQATAESAEAGGPLGGLRVSHAFEDAPGNPAPNGVGEANDFFHSNKLSLRALFNPDEATKLEFMGGGSWQTFGVPGFAVDARGKHGHDFQLLRAERDLGRAGALEASVSRSEFSLEADRFLVVPVDLRVYQYDAEVLHRSAWADERIHSAVGAGWRLSGLYSDQLFAGRPAQQNRIVRGFTHHSAALTDRVTVVAGVSLENSRVGGLQPAWQGAALYSPREEHVFRLSYARAPTMPPLFNKYGDFTLSPATRFLGNPDLTPQQLSSWETGWTCRAMDGALKSGLAVYFMRLEDRNFNFFQTLGPPRVITYDNRNRASAHGVELSEEYSFSPGRALFVNYTFERIRDDKGPTDSFGTDVRRGTPAHKFNIGGRALLTRGFNASALLGYKDAYEANSSTRGTRRPIARSFRLDARLAWSPRPDWVLFLAGQDLLQPYRVAYADGTAVPRLYEGGVTKRFGL
ncbi:MAG: TonB-dependent receptor [Elusimicrobia bacterium]|nr:TonB-dependent receptor [Elusimicrobiota bacterium]